jgi:hypothetical protein
VGARVAAVGGEAAAIVADAGARERLKSLRLRRRMTGGSAELSERYSPAVGKLGLETPTPHSDNSGYPVVILCRRQGRHEIPLTYAQQRTG